MNERRLVDICRRSSGGMGGGPIRGLSPRYPASVEVDVIVTWEEIQTTTSSDPYPPSIHGPLLTTVESFSQGNSNS